MSGTGFHVDPASLLGSGDAVIEVARRLLGETESTEANMRAYGEPWGGDDIGSLIGIAYTEVAAYLFDCLGIAAEEVGSAGSDLTLMAESYEASDEEGAYAMRELSRDLG